MDPHYTACFFPIDAGTVVDPKQFSISIAAPACMSVVLVAPGVGNV